MPPPHLVGAEYVYVHEGCQQQPLAAPCRPIAGVGERDFRVFKVQMGKNVKDISVDRLKPYTGSSPLQKATSAPRGLPKKQAAGPHVQPAP